MGGSFWRWCLEDVVRFKHERDHRDERAARALRSQTAMNGMTHPTLCFPDGCIVRQEFKLKLCSRYIFLGNRQMNCEQMMSRLSKDKEPDISQ